jgi:hypothetical protein
VPESQQPLKIQLLFIVSIWEIREEYVRATAAQSKHNKLI